MKLEHFVTPYTKINTKWIKDLNVRRGTVKLLEENIGKTLSDVHHSRIFYDPPPRVMEIKAKINKWDLIKIKSFCTTKETISKVKTQPSVISKIYKQLLQLNSRKGVLSAGGCDWRPECSPEEPPHVRGQGKKLGGRHARRAAAKRSYPTSEVRGSGRGYQSVMV